MTIKKEHQRQREKIQENISERTIHPDASDRVLKCHQHQQKLIWLLTFVYFRIYPFSFVYRLFHGSLLGSSAFLRSFVLSFFLYDNDESMSSLFDEVV